MSAQLLELIFFAGIAFFIINKLIATLGSTHEDDPTRNNSYFGENTGLKDVTGTATNSSMNNNAISAKKTKSVSVVDISNIEDTIVIENKESIVAQLVILKERVGNFELKHFVACAKAAFKIMIESATNSDNTLDELVDKRYIDQFISAATKYGDISNIDNLDAKISEIYMFGNNAFIKVIFTGKNVVTNIVNLVEEWTFSRNTTAKTSNWYLNNIDRVS